MTWLFKIGRQRKSQKMQAIPISFKTNKTLIKNNAIRKFNVTQSNNKKEVKLSLPKWKMQ